MNEGASRAPPPDRAAPAEAMLVCRDVWKVYGPRAEAVLEAHGDGITDTMLARHELIAAVREVSLDVQRGEIFVIMGLSGSGKSTLVRCMTGLVGLTRGHLLVDGTDLRRLPGAELVRIRRHKMGMVFQDFALLPHLTVLGNVAFPLKVQGVSRAAREAKAREMIRLVGLEGRERYYPHELSGGQQQRVGIARSLTTDPALWFLDEPFSALDPLIRHDMQSEFLRLQTLLAKTIIFITHDFEEAIRLADRIAIMNGGRIVQIGTPETLVLSPADGYVAKFTRSIPRAKVLSAASVMRVGEIAVGGHEPIGADDKIAHIAERVLAASGPVPVQAADGRIVGVLDRDSVTRVLLNKSG